MSTSTRPELSKKNKYFIGKDRYYELKHFCMQYPIWMQAYEALGELGTKQAVLNDIKKRYSVGNPTEKVAMSKVHFMERMEMVEQAAKRTDDVIGPYILKAVTEGLSYDKLKAKIDIPVTKNVYYELYRKFFWELNKIRD